MHQKKNIDLSGILKSIYCLVEYHEKKYYTEKLISQGTVINRTQRMCYFNLQGERMTLRRSRC